MALIVRRSFLVAAGATLAVGWVQRKSYAEKLPDLSTALDMTDPPVPAPDITFRSADGAEHHLSEFIGHGMVINLWATWCAPCVAEMPSLAALSKTLAPDDIAILPLSSDRGGADVVKAFYDRNGIASLPVLLDPKGAAAHAWHARGLPTSIIVDAKGRERARVEGSANWSTPAAASAVRRLVGRN